MRVSHARAPEVTAMRAARFHATETG
jgi:hypothetical protein